MMFRSRVRSGAVAAAGAVVAMAVAPLFGQTPDVAVRSAVIDAPAMLADLKALSADDMEGRRIGTPGGARARALIEARFKAAGLLPFGTAYRHPFTAPAG